MCINDFCAKPKQQWEEMLDFLYIEDQQATYKDAFLSLLSNATEHVSKDGSS